MTQERVMHRKILASAVAVALGCVAVPVLADELGDLKAEIAAQRAQMDAQRLRLEAMEKKLEAAASAQQAAASAQQAAAKPAEAKGFVPSLVASADWEPGFKFQVTPVDVVTLYGLIDATISDISNANAKGDHKRSTQTAWFSGNRWGITGRHGIGENTGIIFKLESEYTFETGEEDTPGVLFNRDAWVGFESPTYGKITLGRQNALARDYSGIYGDPYGSARVTLEEGGYTNTNNFKQLIFYAASATGTRYDRGLVWKKEWGPLVTGVGYQFGGVPGDISNGSTQTLALGFNGPGDFFHLAGFYNQFKVKAAAVPALVKLEHKAWSFGGNVQLGPIARLNAGYYKYNSEQGGNVGNRKDHAWTTSVKFTPAGGMEYDLGYQVITADNAGVNGAGFVLTPYADASGVTRAVDGDKKTTYGSMIYHFDRRAEVYLVADYMKLTDGYRLAVTNGHSSQTEFGLGVRVRF